MTTYTADKCLETRDHDISRWVWDLWELSAVKAWLQTSRSRRQLCKRMEIAMSFYRDTLWWAMSLAFFPQQHLNGLDPEYFNTEEFCWEGVQPTPEAERQILEYASEIGRSYHDEPDVKPERLREILMSRWTMKNPVSGHNRYLLVPELLGEYGFEVTYGT